jgi:4-amino-4-deoxy-L-arabinose transferase-like glycosyltransferase
MYMYATVPSVAVFGLTEVGARVPSVLAGLLSVALVSRLVRRSGGPLAGIAAALLLAVSPWHVLISRTGHEWSFLPAVTIVTVLLVLRALEGRGSWLLAGLAAGACLYTYTPIRISLPLVLIGVALVFRRALWERRRQVAAGVAVAVLVGLPVVVSALGPEGMKRLSVVREKSEGSPFAGFLSRYSRSFCPSFLMHGAKEPELHRLRSTGLLYGFELALLVVGVAAVLWRRDPVGLVLLFWWAAAPLAVAIHRDCPDPILLVTQLPMPQALAGIGAAFLVSWLARLRWLLVALACLAAWPVARMARDLYGSFPTYAARPWTNGVREAVRQAERLRPSFADVVVEGRQKFIFSLILFYVRMDPASRQQEVAGLEGLAYRSRVGPYRIGNVGELVQSPGRHLVWASRVGERLRHADVLHVVKWPDGSDNYSLLEVSSP